MPATLIPMPMPTARRLAARVTLVLVALAVIAWSAILARDAELQDHAVSAARTIPTPASFRAAVDALGRARLLSAATDADIYRAGVMLLQGHSAASLALATQAATREPENLAAWRMVALTAAQTSPGWARLARQRIAALDPLQAR